MKKKLNPRDKKIVRLRLLEGKSRTEVAEVIGVTPKTITRAMQTEEAQKYAEKLDTIREKKHMEAYNKALDIAMEAVEGCMEELVRLSRESENEKIREDACLKIAYMAGLKPREAENTGRTQKLVIEQKPEPKKDIKSA